MNVQYEWVKQVTERGRGCKRKTTCLLLSGQVRLKASGFQGTKEAVLSQTEQEGRR